VIYGSSQSSADQLRDIGNQGRMKTSTDSFGRPLLPFNNTNGAISFSAGPYIIEFAHSLKAHVQIYGLN